jgi:WD40 repeat protein
VLLYELLAGSTPFDANELMSQGIDQMRKTIREQEPPRSSTRLATLGAAELTTTAKRRSADTSRLMHQLKGDLDWIVMKCLEKDRMRRYETANGLAADLKRHLNNETVIARPPSAAYKFQKAFRRNKLVFTAAGAVTAALVLGIIASTWQSIRANHAKQQALAAEARAIQAQADETKQRQLAEKEARQAEQAKEVADRESIAARRTAAESDAHYLLHEGLLPDALAKATEAFKLGGAWEDGLLINDIAETARQNWVLSARVPLSEPANVACVTRFKDRPCLVMSVASGLRVIDALNGAMLGSVPFSEHVWQLFQGVDSNTVVAVSDASVSLFSLPSLTVAAKEELPAPLGFAAANGTSLILLLNNHDVHILDLSNVSEVASFNWDTNPGTKKFQAPRHACVSPDGKLALLHGGSYLDPVVVWDRRSDPPTFTARDIPMQEFKFIDNKRFATWELVGNGETETPDNINVYDAEHTPVAVMSQSIPNDNIKGHVEFQAWSAKEWGFETDFPIVGGIGPSGLGFKGMDTTGEFQGDFSFSDRYANLLPSDADTLKFLAAGMDKGVLALQSASNLLIFQLSWLHWSGATRDYCATACSNGLLYMSRAIKPAPILTFIPFDPRQKPARFSLQWPSDSKWLPWAVAATPDASTVAVVGQETDSGNRFNAHYGRVRALIYRTGSLTDGPSAWPIQNAFQIDAPDCLSFTPRFLALDTEGHALLYWNSTSTVNRYDCRDGKPLGTLELGLVSARSRDGRRVASVSPDGRIRVYDLSTGDVVLDQQSKPAAGICLSPEGSRLVASQEGMLKEYDVASGRVLSSVPSKLLPLACPAHGSHLLAFQPDTTGLGGSVVLADTGDARVAAVLNRAGTSFTPAYFSDSGNQIAIISRFDTKVVRSLRPEEIPAVLNTPLPETTELQPLAPATIATTAVSATAVGSEDVFDAGNISGLQSHMGDLVTVQGRVRNITLVTSGSAANIYFETAGTTPVQVWVPWDPFPKLKTRLGKDLEAALHGRTIKATGRLSLYRGNIELTLSDAGKFVIVSPGVAIGTFTTKATKEDEKKN